eukprot:678864-Amphidinium_carterae.1
MNGREVACSGLLELEVALGQVEVRPSDALGCVHVVGVTDGVVEVSLPLHQLLVVQRMPLVAHSPNSSLKALVHCLRLLRCNAHVCSLVGLRI